MRDSRNHYEPLERLFGVLAAGNAFGESALLYENRRKFYNAITFTECYFLTIQKLEFDHFITEVEKRDANEKICFLKTIPELSHVGISRTKLANISKHLQPVTCIKNYILYKQGEPFKYVYFVREGELKLCKKVVVPQTGEEIEEMYENPD